MKKAVILFGSPHKKGGTNEITKWAEERLAENGYECKRIDLYSKNVNFCMGCSVCQKVDEGYGCIHKDDVADIFNAVLESDLIVVASPIHGNFVSAKLKLVLDRLVYIMNKYVGRKPEEWIPLWKGKHFIALISYAVRFDKIFEPIDVGLELYCKHSCLFYDGFKAVHRKNYMMRMKSGDEDLFGDKKEVFDFIDETVKKCSEDKKVDWSPFTGKPLGKE